MHGGFKTQGSVQLAEIPGSKNKGLSEEQINEFKEVFKLFDTDGSGAISHIELGNVLRQLGQNPTDQELKNLVEEVDIDGSGQIEFNEFVQMMGRMLEEDEENDDFREPFDMFDTDGDGHISMMDIKRVINNLGERFTD